MVKSGSSRRHRGTQRHIGRKPPSLEAVVALLGAALAQLVASKFSGQWKDCDKCSRRPRPGLRHEIGCEIVDPTKRRRQDFEGQSHETKDKGNENRHRGESAGDANDGRRA
jgi:hypothetical protein